MVHPSLEKPESVLGATVRHQDTRCWGRCCDEFSTGSTSRVLANQFLRNGQATPDSRTDDQLPGM